jgi:hypothetical protein
LITSDFSLSFSFVDPEITDCSWKTVFWLQSDLEKILQSLGLPKRYTQVLGGEHTVFACISPVDSGNNSGRFGKGVF